MNSIVAVDRNWGIGKDNGLLLRIPEDMKYFRRMTLGKTVIMGYTTMLTMPGARPLDGRRNIVLSRGRDVPQGFELCRSLDACFRLIAPLDADEVFIIGGGSVYAQFLPYCAALYVTKIDAALEADTRFPDIDALGGWTLAESSAPMLYEGTQFRFCRYENDHPLPPPP